MNKIIAIDFDNTLFETDYPAIVRPISPVIKYAKFMRERGAKLILWTCREGKELEEAVEACRAEGLLFDAVNDNLPEMKAEWGNNPRKVAADEYWDDRALYFERVEPVCCGECRYYDKRSAPGGLGWCSRPGIGCGHAEDFWCAGAERKEEKDG